jgi:hypothetical protein
MSSGWLGDAAQFSFGTSKRYEIGVGIPGETRSFIEAPGPGTYGTESCLAGRVMENKHSTEVEYPPPPPPRVCMTIQIILKVSLALISVQVLILMTLVSGGPASEHKE